MCGGFPFRSGLSKLPSGVEAPPEGYRELAWLREWPTSITDSREWPYAEDSASLISSVRDLGIEIPPDFDIWVRDWSLIRRVAVSPPRVAGQCDVVFDVELSVPVLLRDAPGVLIRFYTDEIVDVDWCMYVGPCGHCVVRSNYPEMVDVAIDALRDVWDDGGSIEAGYFEWVAPSVSDFFWSLQGDPPEQPVGAPLWLSDAAFWGSLGGMSFVALPLGVMFHALTPSALLWSLGSAALTLVSGLALCFAVELQLGRILQKHWPGWRLPERDGLDPRTRMAKGERRSGGLGSRGTLKRYTMSIVRRQELEYEYTIGSPRRLAALGGFASACSAFWWVGVVLGALSMMIVPTPLGMGAGGLVTMTCVLCRLWTAIRGRRFRRLARSLMEEMNEMEAELSWWTR